MLRIFQICLSKFHTTHITRFLRILATDGQSILIMPDCCVHVVKYFSQPHTRTSQKTRFVTPIKTDYGEMLYIFVVLHVQCLIFLSDYKQNRNLWTKILVKNPKL
jgi:hypothetical protein